MGGPPISGGHCLAPARKTEPFSWVFRAVTVALDSQARLSIVPLSGQVNQAISSGSIFSCSTMQTSHERDSSDILKNLMQAKAASGTGSLTRQDLFAEAVVMMVAGSDTTSTTLVAFFFHVSRNPRRLRKGDGRGAKHILDS
jgi:cytochrome P450